MGLLSLVLPNFTHLRFLLMESNICFELYDKRL